MRKTFCVGLLAALIFASLPSQSQTPTTAQIEAKPDLAPAALHHVLDRQHLGILVPGYNGGKHVQNDIQQMWVKPDGTVYTGAAWDEGHFAGGIYKNGDQLGTMQDTFQDFLGIGPLAGDARYVYTARGKQIRRYNPGRQLIRRLTAASPLRLTVRKTRFWP